MKKISTKAIMQCLFSTVAVMLIQITNAQIVYTNIQDIQLSCKKYCQLYHYFDLNNDGTLDFGIYMRKGSVNFDCNGCNDHDNAVEAGSILENHLGFTATDDPVNNYPSSLVPGIEIGSLLSWNEGNLLRVDYAYCNEWYPYYSTVKCVSGSGGNWTSKKDHYLGLKLISNGQTYYGWARLSVSVNSNTALCILKDYAYESTPGKSIIAGDTGESSATKTSSDNANEEIVDDTKLTIVPNPLSASATISFSLSGVSNVSLSLYDVNGRLIKRLANKQFSNGHHQITLDTKDLNAGIYLLRLQSPESIETRKVLVLK